MSILQRYKKAGGFFQLIQLIEASNPEKQKKLLAAVNKEDPSWAEGLKQKALSFEKFCGWSPETHQTVLWGVSPQYRWILCENLPKPSLERLSEYLNPQEKREMEEAFENSRGFSDGEFLSAKAKLFETIRKMDQDKVILLSRIEPTVAVDPAA